MTFELILALRATTTKLPRLCVILQATLLTVVVPVLPASVIGNLAVLSSTPVNLIPFVAVYARPGVPLTALAQQPLPGVLILTFRTRLSGIAASTRSPTVLVSLLTNRRGAARAPSPTIARPRTPFRRLMTFNPVDRLFMLTFNIHGPSTHNQQPITNKAPPDPRR